MNWKKNPICFYFLFTEKMNCRVEKNSLHEQQTHLNFRKILHHFLLYNVRHGHLAISSRQLCIEGFSHCLRPYGSLWMSFWWCNVGVDTYSTMNYGKVITKLNENNVTYVIQTRTSLNYFDSSRKTLTYILNGSQ